MANAMLSPDRNNAIPTDVSEEKTNTRKRKAESAAAKKPSSKSAKSDSVSSLSAAASSSKDRGSDRRPTAVASQGKSGSDPPISDVLNVLKTIQESQCKSDQNFNVLSHRVDELFKMAEDYDDCGDYGLFPDSDVVTVDDCTADNSVDISNANKDTTTSSGADDKFKSAGEKLKIKEVCDTSVNAELASCVNDWFRQGIENDR